MSSHARKHAKHARHGAHSPARRYVYPDARPSRSSSRAPWPRRSRGGVSRLIRLATLVVACAAAVAAAAVAANAQAPRELGVGVVAGDPIGGTAKLWLDDALAVDAGVGFSGDVAFWGDLLWHDRSLLPQPAEGKLALYLGAGPRLETGEDDAEFAVRTIAGLSWRLERSPLELFAEAGPVFRMTQGGGVGADGGVGVRLYLR